MEGIALSLFVAALRDAALLSLPIVGIVAAIGVGVGIVQTIVQVQDQNVAFAPKLAAVAVIIGASGPAALELLRALFVLVIEALPGLGRS